MTRGISIFIPMTLLAALMISAACQVSNSTQPINDSSFKSFQQFLNIHGKQYGSFGELGLRYKAFQDTFSKIQKYQNKHQNATYTLGINKFSDLSPQEFQNTYCNLQTNLTEIAQSQTGDENSFVGGDLFSPNSRVVDIESSTNETDLNNLINNYNGNTILPNKTNNNDTDSVNLKASTSAYCTISSTTVPSAFDWRNCNAVTPVKNQGSCGCCWAFSSIGTIEGQYAIKYGYLVSLSEQQLMNCDTTDNGCSGGFMTTALNFAATNKLGVPGQGAVPYLGYKSTCNTNVGNTVSVKGYSYAGSTSETVIMQFLYKVGPLAVSINSNSYLQNYSSGILNLSASQCSPSVINHAVTIVGYGVENGVNYWIVKNSWGADWGESGYFRIVRGTSACGINNYAVAAILN